MSEHIICAGETLSSVAGAYGLSGWQGLYYAEVNQAFRQRHPDPWYIPIGIAIAIPESAPEQQDVLARRIHVFAALERDVRQLGSEQGALLASKAAPAPPRAEPAALGEITRGLVATTLRAIRLLKAAERGSSRANLALAEDALGRWPLAARNECASLLTLLTRAAESVPWAIPAGAARSWCDAGSPNYWAKCLFPTINGQGAFEPERLLTILRGAQQIALANVMQQLGSLRVGAIMESSRLARLQATEQNP